MIIVRGYHMKVQRWGPACPSCTCWLTSHPLRNSEYTILAVYRSIKSAGIEAESRGERYYICVIGQISLVYEGVKKIRTYPAQGWQMEKVRERCGAGVTAMSFLISEFSLAFKPLPPLPPHCNKSWHLFVTYDCISDCLRRDSIPTPRSACDGGIASLSDGEIEGFVAQMPWPMR